MTTKQTFTASLWQEDEWWIARCIEVDVASQGETEQEALANLIEALELYFESPVDTMLNGLFDSMIKRTSHPTNPQTN